MDARTSYVLNKVNNFLDNVEAELEPLTEEARADMQSALYCAVSVYDSEKIQVFLEWVPASFNTANLNKALLCPYFSITGCFIIVEKGIEGITIKAGVKPQAWKAAVLEITTDCEEF